MSLPNIGGSSKTAEKSGLKKSLATVTNRLDAIADKKTEDAKKESPPRNAVAASTTATQNSVAFRRFSKIAGSVRGSSFRVANKKPAAVGELTRQLSRKLSQKLSVSSEMIELDQAFPFMKAGSGVSAAGGGSGAAGSGGSSGKTVSVSVVHTHTQTLSRLVAGIYGTSNVLLFVFFVQKNSLHII